MMSEGDFTWSGGRATTNYGNRAGSVVRRAEWAFDGTGVKLTIGEGMNLGNGDLLIEGWGW